MAAAKTTILTGISAVAIASLSSRIPFESNQNAGTGEANNH
jgi:hypothetical protein